MSPKDQQILALLIVLGVWLTVKYRRPWRGSGTAHGTARWASESDIRHMLVGKGLPLGRTLRRNKMIQIPKYVHLSVYAPTGAGKGISFVIPTLLSYVKGSVFVLDPKAELYLATAAMRKKALGQKIYVIDPFGLVTELGCSDCWNPLSTIQPGPTLIDEARAMSEALIVRNPDGDRDAFWNNFAVILFTTMITATCLFMRTEDRHFGTVREMMTHPEIFSAVIKRLQSVGGVYARMANQIAKLIESGKTAADVTSTANSHAAFFDSELVSKVLSKSTFSADVLLRPGSTIYFILPVEHLDAQKGYTRLLVSTYLRHIMRHGVDRGGEVLFLLDECAAALSGLDALAQAFVLGRGKGIRLYTFWQSLEQAQVAFKKTPNLVADNSDQIFFSVNSYASADLVSKMLGNRTIVIESAGENISSGHTHASGSNNASYNTGSSGSRNYSEIAQPLLNPSQVLQLNGEYLIGLFKGCPPILARRIKYYSDPLFCRRTSGTWSLLLCWILLLTVIALLWKKLSS